jgi:hypothetical protein
VKEEEYSSAGLIADARYLLLTHSSGEQKPRFAGSGRSHYDPALILSLDRRVLDQSKAEPVDIKIYGFVVIPYDEGDLANGLLHGHHSNCRTAATLYWR